MRYEFWLGLRYLFAKRRERFISIIAVLSVGGVALGVFALIVVMAVMSGFDHDITEKLVGTNAHIVVDAPAGVRDVEEVARHMSGLDHVVGVSPFVYGQAILRLEETATGVFVRGIDLQREVRVNRLGEYMIRGRLPQTDEEVVIGTELSASIAAGPGDPLLLISPVDGKLHTFTISGLFRSGMFEYDSTLVCMTLAQAQRFYALEGVVTGLGVKLDKIEHAERVRLEAQARLGPEYTVRTWQDLNPALFGALKVEKTVMFIILTLIIVVAALNILSMLIMIVMEKTKDIGILRALGATRGSIAALFLSQGCFIGLVGIGLGLAAGVATTRNLDAIAQWLERTFGVSVFPPTIYYLDHIPARIDAADVAGIAAATFVLTVLAGTYAAARAAALAPVDALRYE